MLPKLISSLVEKTPTEVDPDEEDGEADVSMDGSTSCMSLGKLLKHNDADDTSSYNIGR